MIQEQTRAPAYAEQSAQTSDDFDRLLRREYSPREMLDGDNMDKMLRLAEQLSCSKLSVPDHLRGNIGDCLAIVTQAMLWNMNPFAVAQKTHLVNGKLGYEAQLVNAVLQNSGAVRGLPQYDYEGDGQNLECRVGFVPRGETEVVWGEWLNISTVKVKNSPLWVSNPRQQLGYLQVKNWARAFCPGAILGVYTVDELDGEDLPPLVVNRGPQRKSATESAAPVAASSSPAAPAPAAPAAQDAKPAAPAPAAAAPAPAPAQSGGGGISGGQVAYLRKKLDAAGLGEATVCDRFQVTGIELLSAEQFDEMKSELLANA